MSFITFVNVCLEVFCTLCFEHLCGNTYHNVQFINVSVCVCDLISKTNIYLFETRYALFCTVLHVNFIESMGMCIDFIIMRLCIRENKSRGIFNISICVFITALCRVYSRSDPNLARCCVAHSVFTVFNRGTGEAGDGTLVWLHGSQFIRAATVWRHGPKKTEVNLK